MPARSPLPTSSRLKPWLIQGAVYGAALGLLIGLLVVTQGARPEIEQIREWRWYIVVGAGVGAAAGALAWYRYGPANNSHDETTQPR